jgi:glycosyltransferase involved in cell wall biosynthesis
VVEEEPVVSVVVPCLNRAHVLAQALDSVLSQDYGRIECIVMDGGSSDGTLDVLRSYGERISWVSAPDSGPADAINRGWQRSSGEILAWLNADDTWQPAAVTRVVAYLNGHPEADVVFGACGGIDEEGRSLWLERPRPWSLERAVLRYDPQIHQPAAFMRRAILEKVGWLTPDWCHDHDLWLRIGIAGGRIEPLDEHLADCRVWPEDANKQPGLMVPAVQRVVDRLYANPSLPVAFRGYESTTRSFAYLRCIRYLWFGSPSHWLQASRLLWLAFRTRPSGVVALTRELAGLTAPLARSAVGRLRLTGRPA